MPDNAWSTRPWLASYAPGVAGRLVYERETIPDLLARSARAFPKRVATDFLGATRTYADIAADVERVAAGLAGLGVRAGDRVAILLPNCPQHLVAFYAVLHLGATVVEHNPLYTEHELTGPFKDHRARVAIAWDSITPMLLRMADHSGAPLEHVVAVDLTRALPLSKRAAMRLPVPAARKVRKAMTTKAPEGTIDFEELRGKERAPRHEGEPEDIALMLYTSGTTGEPKGVPLTHANILANNEQGRAWVPGLVEGEETLLSVLPGFHAYGVTFSPVFGVGLAATLVLMPKPEIDLMLAAIKRTRPTFIPAVPPLYARILDEARKKGLSLQGIRYSFSGAMSLPAELVDKWEQATGGLLVEGYGLTEASPIVVGNPMSQARKPGAIGVPFPDTEIRIADLDDVAQDARPGEPGELLVKGPQVFAGYHGKPEETAETFHDGWLRTGDVVTMDEKGFLTIVDRIKETIVTGGFNVYPSEVEAVLREHPDVEDAAVVPVRQGDGSEHVGAVVVLADKAELNGDRLRTFCREELAAYKIPRHFTATEELPKNPMGKVLRREAAKLLSDA